MLKNVQYAAVAVKLAIRLATDAAVKDGFRLKITSTRDHTTQILNQICTRLIGAMNHRANADGTCGVAASNWSITVTGCRVLTDESS
jgi:hypothetical protein